MKIGVAASIILTLAVGVGGQVSSVYTDLDDRKCKTLESAGDNGVNYKGECKGVGGYKLHVIEGDLRQTIDVIAPDGETHELLLWQHFGGFSAVGPRAEWRVKSKKPFALIFRFNVNENPEDSSKYTSYLLVAKITDMLACVTDIIKPSQTQNAEARRAADRAANTPCKTAD